MKKKGRVFNWAPLPREVFSSIPSVAPGHTSTESAPKKGNNEGQRAYYAAESGK